MSQKKVDERKQSKGDMLHQAKKQMTITTALDAAVLVVIAGIAVAFAYSGGYARGEKAGYDDGFEFGMTYQDYLNKLEASKTTTAADKDKETTKADKESTKANDEKETEKATEKATEESTEKETEAAKEDK